MTISPGNYILRNGWKARVLCDDAPGTYPLVGYCRSPKLKDEVLVYKWQASGRAPYAEDPSPIDILHADYEPDWSEAPEWAQWYSVDSNGSAYWRSLEPNLRYSTFWASPDGTQELPMCESVNTDSFPMANINWKETLRKRP